MSMANNDFKQYLSTVIDNENYEKDARYLTASADCFFPIAAKKLIELGVKQETAAYLLISAACEILEGDDEKVLKMALRLSRIDDGMSQ